MDISTAKIPKVIHYCWFGGNEKPNIVKRCIESWSKVCPEYEIMEWNENNFSVTCNDYVNEAYQARKFAFVSDYVRVYALYHYGGIYLDTDVEVFKPFDDLLHHDSFWGFEQGNYIATSTIGAVKGNSLIGLFLEAYEDIRFLKEDGSFNDLTNVAMITKELQRIGLVLNGQYQVVDGTAAFYPQMFFSPYDYINCRKFITKDTYTMHHFYKSWLPAKTRIKGSIKLTLAKIIGGNNIARLRGFAAMIALAKKITATLLAECHTRGVYYAFVMNLAHLIAFLRGFINKLMYARSIRSSVFALQAGSSIEIYSKYAKADIGKFVFIRKHASIRLDLRGSLHIEDKVFINDNCTINCVNKVVIGSRTKIAPNVCINDHDHNYKGAEDHHLLLGEVIIGRNVWVGSNVVILRDTYIGDNAVIAAGSVVKGHVPANTLFLNKREKSFIPHAAVLASATAAASNG